jgi:hypothetical protein
MQSDRHEMVFRARNPADDLAVMVARLVAERPGLSLFALGTYTALMAYREEGAAIDSMTDLAVRLAADRAAVDDVVAALLELRTSGVIDFDDTELTGGGGA